MFFSPGFPLARGVSIETVWDGIRAGLADAHHDLDVKCRMILDFDKPSGPGPAAELVEFAGKQDRDLLVGVGGDSTERGVDHRAFAPVFTRAKQLGLHRTFHAGEDGPADNIAAAFDDLGCERIDHGFRLLDDPDLTARIADARVPLTVCPISNVVIANVIDDVADHPFARQREAGVLVTVNSDDPGMMGTTICDDYEAVTDRFGYDADTIEDITLDAISASWAPADEQAALRQRFVTEMADLRVRHGLAPRYG
jgi:adenosine deaminase